MPLDTPRAGPYRPRACTGWYPVDTAVVVLPPPVSGPMSTCRRRHFQTPRPSSYGGALDHDKFSRRLTCALTRSRSPHLTSRLSGAARCYAVRLCRALGRGETRVSLASVRSASLTAWLSGKSCATSGSRSTTLVPCAYRAAVTPRTALEKSYSGRIVSPSAAGFLVLVVFIFPSLVARGQSGADDPCPWRPLGIRDHHEPRSARHPEHDEALLALGVIGIRHVHGQDVTEDRAGLIEGDTMVLEVRGCLLRIPFEAVPHLLILSSSRSSRELIGITSALSRVAQRQISTDEKAATAPAPCWAAGLMIRSST